VKGSSGAVRARATHKKRTRVRMADEHGNWPV
jgi:hypothetical protein